MGRWRRRWAGRLIYCNTVRLGSGTVYSGRTGEYAASIPGGGPSGFAYEGASERFSETKMNITRTGGYFMPSEPSFTYGGGARSAAPAAGYSLLGVYGYGPGGRENTGRGVPYWIPCGKPLPECASGSGSEGGAFDAARTRWMRRRWMPQQRRKRQMPAGDIPSAR